MSTSDHTVRELAEKWRSSNFPRSWQFVSRDRSALFAAASRQIESKAEQNIHYDPFLCPLFRWCAQWLDVADGKRDGIDPEIEFLFRLSMDPAPLSQKLLAANDDAEPDTAG
jgi:hypothetical protein